MSDARAARSTAVGDDGRERCAWVSGDPEYIRYHDQEWGTPLHGDRPLFEKLCLEGFQAGLSWITILKRRPAFREVFHGFEPGAVAAMDAGDVARLMTEARIIRNRAKIEATIGNARALLDLQAADAQAPNAQASNAHAPDEQTGHHGPLDALIWGFAPPPRAARPVALSEIPAVTRESTALSKALRSAGFRFVGATTMYALMQSAGLVDDHVSGCWRAG